MPYIGRPIDAGDYKEITLTESFDGSRTAFTMSESVGSHFQIFVILSGVLTTLGDSYTTIQSANFSAAPSTGETIKILKIGDTLSINQPSSGSVGVAQLSTTGIAAGKVFKVMMAGTSWELGNASSAEVYLFNVNGNNLEVITTNGGQSNITNAQYLQLLIKCLQLADLLLA